MELWPGRSHPLGATWDGDGTNFAVYSERAEGVELCTKHRASPSCLSSRPRGTSGRKVGNAAVTANSLTLAKREGQDMSP